MADADETPQQRQLRLRQAKREAKLKASGQDRLDKITKLSGRTPDSVRHESPAFTPPIAATPPRLASPAPNNTPPMPPLADTGDPEQMRAQEEYLRMLLANSSQQQPGQGQMPDENDPMMKMLQSMLGGMNGDPNTAGQVPFSPDDISKATGLPSFVTNMFMGGKPKAPPTEAELRSARQWKVIHVIFALLAGMYTLWTVSRSMNTFGENPPAPATLQNPFVIFLTIELLVHGSRVAMSGQPVKSGPGAWLQVAKDVARDGSILVFMLGVYSWWEGWV